jgi:hypothetical protein
MKELTIALLRSDVKAWNKAKKEQQDEQADLNWADLRGAILHGADLRRADLREADLSEAILRGADLRGADLRGADLRGADLREAKGHIPLTSTDHGYYVFAMQQEGGSWKIVAGCHEFSPEEALKHWGASDYHTPRSGRRCVSAVKWFLGEIQGENR